MRLRACCLLCLCLAAGCGHLSDIRPEGFDLSGFWVLDRAASDPAPRYRPRPGRRRPPHIGEVLAQAEELTIEQDPRSMGLKVPGEPLRDVDWGETERGALTIRAAWDEQGALIVHSRREDWQMLERFSLSADRRQLVIEIERSPAPRGAGRIVRRFRREMPPQPVE